MSDVRKTGWVARKSCAPLLFRTM